VVEPSLEYSVSPHFNGRGLAVYHCGAAVVAVLLLAAIKVSLYPRNGTLTTLTTILSTSTIDWLRNVHQPSRTLQCNGLPFILSVYPFRSPKPGSLCDPHLFKVGDAFTTNYTYFEWNIDGVVKANAGDSAISYKGIPLTFCDVTSIYITGDLPSWSGEFTVIVMCKQDDMFKLTAEDVPSHEFSLVDIQEWSASPRWY